MKKPVLFVLLLLLPLLMARAEDTPETLSIISRENYNPRSFNISDEDWRWLGQKRELKIGVWLPETPPFDMFTESGKYEGIDADYSLLVTQYLGMRSQITRFASREQALQALETHQVDIVTDPTGNPLPIHSTLVGSRSFLADNPTLMRRISDQRTNWKAVKNLHLAVSHHYLDLAWLKQHFPEASIQRFDTDEEALASLAFGNSDYYLGNLTTASYLVGRNYNNLLAVQEIFPVRAPGSRFLMRAADWQLVNAVNSVLAAIPATQNQVIYQQWSEGSDLLPIINRLNFNEREKRWLKENPNIPVVVNSLYAPFTMVDAQGNFYGISADLLRLIRLRTGINFTPVVAESVNEMFRDVKGGKARFIAAISYSDMRDNQLRFTRPYFASPFVLVVQQSQSLPMALNKHTRIAITENNMLIPELKKQYPGINLVTVANASIAMQLVNEGKVNGAVHTLVGGGYMIDRYFRNNLKIAMTLGDASSQISFAVSPDQPELLSILNKALADIAPRTMTRVINKWQTSPDVQLDTWAAYRTQFWLLGGLTLAIGLTSLIWIYYLRRQISARRRAQQSLQSQLQFSDKLLNNVQVPVYVVDRQGGLVLFNQSWQEFFKGDSVNGARGSVADVNNPLNVIWREIKDEVIQGNAAPQPSPQAFQIFNGESQRSVIHNAVRYLDDSQQTAGLICSWIDVTEHQRLTTDLSLARERAEQANRAKSTFLATMSHEIRTPVSAIIGLLELAVSAPGRKTDDDEPVKVAWESARSLMGLIGDILDMARIESGRLELAPEWVRSTELAPPVVRVFEGLARQKSLRLSCTLPPVMPYEVFIDALRFRQILSNLVSNAIKFTEKGSVEVNIDITALENNEVRLSVSVKDSGKGISAGEQHDIFNPWVQAEDGKRQSGSGLGLAICSQLVQMMSGNITLQSEPGRGTEVTFTLALATRSSRPEEIPAKALPAAIEVPPLRILAVDDHPANRMLLRRQLARLGHQVTEASDGEEAWEIWQQQQFDLLITDCSMPGMDGLELTRLIRAHQTQPLMIVGLTANAWPEERARCQQAGMDDCMFKPLQLPQLQAMLGQVALRMAKDRPAPSELEQMLSFSGLNNLTQGDDELLHSLLSVTLTTQRQDIVEAAELLELEDWPEMAKCIHRMSGACQIISANKAEALCRRLEDLCRQDDVSAEETQALWQETENELAILNRAIENYLAGN